VYFVTLRQPAVMIPLERLQEPWRYTALQLFTRYAPVNSKYSGTSVYVRFGRSPTWYTSCLDAKNFVWYTTFVWNMTRVRQNESRDFVFFFA
jgi:hypothetical protein